MTIENYIKAYLDDMAQRGDNQAANLLSALEAATSDNMDINNTIQTFTAFCMQRNREGTIWIDSVMAIDKESAKIQAVLDCAADWAHDPDSIDCIGLAAGDVEILDWTL